MYGDFTIEVKSVKVQGSDYLLNGSLSVPNQPGNIECQAIMEWIAKGNTPEPEFTEEELKALAWEDIKAQANEELRATDDLCRADVWEDITPGKRSQIKDFRSTLRALRVDPGKNDPGQVVFPEIPDVIKEMVNTKTFLKREPKQKDVQK